MTGKMTLHTGGRYGVSHQCELLNVSANRMIGKMTLNTGGIHVVSHQYELLNVSARLENFQRFCSLEGTAKMRWMEDIIFFHCQNY